LPAIEDILGPDGPLARTLPSFAPRAEQIEMARCVADALLKLEPLVIEAGTGTGKTFAYLVPALLSGRHVIISTGTRTLQDQLFHRDLPAISAALGRPVKIALLKGRANYLCRHRLKLARAAPDVLPLPLAGEGGAEGRRHDAAQVFERIETWALRTVSGDVSELTQVPEGHAIWPAVTSTRENCLGTECPEFAACHVFAARREAQAADIVIVNHHLLLADLALKESGFGDLLPGTEAVILDEAHQVPETAAQFFGASLSARQVLGFARDTAAELKAAGMSDSGLAGELRTLEALVMEIRAAFPRGSGRIDWRSVPAVAVERLAELEATLTRAHAILRDLDGPTGVSHCARRSEELLRSCVELRSLEEDAGARWIDLAMQSWTLRFIPFEVADRLQQFITAGPCAWIFTSATLAIGEDFSHYTARIGVPQARSVRIESPFDYRRQALIYLPESISDPAHPDHARHTVEAALPLLETSGGRAFLLFTSHRALGEASEWLRHKLGERQPFPLFTQGEAPREVLLREFRELGNAVLLGTSSFWEGVDVKGDALSLVVIDKLPFASPDDPVLSARLAEIRRRGGNPFFEYQLPQAVLALKQGVGRLIRDANDTGVIMLCDPRLMTRAYGRVFIESLPPMPATTSLREAIAGLEQHLPSPRPSPASGRGSRNVALDTPSAPSPRSRGEGWGEG
jgi:ATP-dependent DNA helicase DinG